MIHIMAAHFIKKLNIQSLQSTKHTLLHNNSVTLQSRDNLDEEYGKDFDVETSMEAEASPAKADTILDAYSTDFVAGNAVGKLMAFISQIRASCGVTQDYLHELCHSNNCPAWEIKLWICTCWGSLSDCFSVVLGVQWVGIFLISDTIAHLHSQAIDIFCVLADENEDIPPLANSKKWSNYKLAGAEWQLIQLAYSCLLVCLHFFSVFTFVCYRFLGLHMESCLWKRHLHATSLSTAWKDSNRVGGPSWQPSVLSSQKHNTG